MGRPTNMATSAIKADFNKYRYQTGASGQFSDVKTPHITHVQAGLERWDPMFQSIFEVILSAPTALSKQKGIEGDKGVIKLLPEHVTEVSGLDALQKTPAAGQQKFMGVDVSFLNPVLDNTYAEITIQFNLNLNKTNSPEILLFFKEWARLNYDISSGDRSLKEDYTADTVIINEANRNGDIWRKVTLRNVILTAYSGLDSLSYESNEIRKLSVTLRADYWDEQIASWAISA